MSVRVWASDLWDVHAPALEGRDRGHGDALHLALEQFLHFEPCERTAYLKPSQVGSAPCRVGLLRSEHMQRF